ncbi:MAG: M23 family metallopeptidase [Alphaproteobacteria bacterium]
MIRRSALAVLAVLLPLAAGAVELSGTPVQGALLVGHAPPGARVTLDGRALAVDAATGAFVFGFGRDAGPAAELTVLHADGRREAVRLAVARRDWRIERVDGLPPATVTPPPEVQARIARESAELRAARAGARAVADFLGGFAWPAVGRISGVFGSQRILNGEPRAPHLGTDIAAPVGAPVVASAAGTVTLATADFFYTGGTVVIDHGHGVTTVYAHLSEVAVRAGETVARGGRIGAVGATGRVSGPHLHWGLYWFATPLDPELVAGPPPG